MRDTKDVSLQLNILNYAPLLPELYQIVSTTKLESSKALNVLGFDDFNWNKMAAKDICRLLLGES